jgi:molybdopterin biosynthesis enzyme MoaB
MHFTYLEELPRMNAEIITIGTELLLGEIVDTNAAHIARQLRTIGLNLYYKTTVGDNQARCADAINRALNRSDVVITTGGLGPRRPPAPSSFVRSFWSRSRRVSTAGAPK